MSKIKAKKLDESYIILPSFIANDLKQLKKSELKVLIYLFSKEDTEVEELSFQLDITPQEVAEAIEYWATRGLIDNAEEDKKKNMSGVSLFQHYDSQILSQALEKDNNFKSVCDFVEELLGKILNKNEYNSLFYLYDYVGLTAEFICSAAKYCHNNKKRSMQYLMKTCLGLFDDGIDNYEKLAEYLAKKEKAKENINKLRTMCGIGERDFSSKENAIFTKWFEEYFLDFELVRLAYEKTVDSLGKISFNYMNTILENWHKKGCRTVDDVLKNDVKSKDGITESSFDADEFFETALRRGKERGKDFIKKKK